MYKSIAKDMKWKMIILKQIGSVVIVYNNSVIKYVSWANCKMKQIHKKENEIDIFIHVLFNCASQRITSRILLEHLQSKKKMIWQFYQIYTLCRRCSRRQLICCLWILFLRKIFNMIWKVFSIKNENFYYKNDRKHKMYLIDNFFCFYF